MCTCRFLLRDWVASLTKRYPVWQVCTFFQLQFKYLANLLSAGKLIYGASPASHTSSASPEGSEQLCGPLTCIVCLSCSMAGCGVCSGRRGVEDGAAAAAEPCDSLRTAELHAEPDAHLLP